MTKFVDQKYYRVIRKDNNKEYVVKYVKKFNGFITYVGATFKPEWIEVIEESCSYYFTK